MQIKDNRQLHTIFMLLLLVVLVLGVFLFYIFSSNPFMQFATVIMFSFLYFVWGVTYHWFKGEIHLKIVVEYLLISILAILLLRGAIFR